MGNQTFVGHTVRITVVKVACYTDLAEKYNQARPGAPEGAVEPCNFFREGMVFEVTLNPFENCKPEGFCDWAWADIWKDCLLVCDRAGFAPGDDVKSLKPHFTCCTDGLRPVTFMIEAIA